MSAHIYKRLSSVCRRSLHTARMLSMPTTRRCRVCPSGQCRLSSIALALMRKSLTYSKLPRFRALLLLHAREDLLFSESNSMSHIQIKSEVVSELSKPVWPMDRMKSREVATDWLNTCTARRTFFFACSKCKWSSVNLFAAHKPSVFCILWSDFSM